MVKSTQGSLWRMGLVALGVLALLVGYYWVHKPAGLGLVISLGGAGLDILTTGLLITLAGGLGRRLLHGRLDCAPLSLAERVTLESGIGLGLFSLMTLTIGLLGLLNRPVIFALLAVVATLALPTLRGWLRDFRSAPLDLRPTTCWAGFLMVFVVFALITALIHAVAPPTAWDALMYHLAAPQQYLRDARITAHLDNHYYGFPQNIEMLFTLTVGIFGRDTAAAPVHFAFGCLAVMAAIGIIRRFADVTAAWMGAALLLSSYSLWLLFGWPYIDLGVMVYALLAFIAILHWHETHSDSWLALAGFFAGVMLGAKYTAGLMLAALLLYAFWRSPRTIIRSGLILGGVALITFAPWLVKGALLYGNPVYPFFFGGLNWDNSRSAAFSHAGQGLLNGSAWQLPILPIAATIFGVEKAPGYSFTTGAWLLTTPLLVLIGWRWLDDRARQLTRSALLLMAVLLLGWMGGAALSEIALTPRQAVSYIGLSAVVGALGFYSLPRKPFDLYFIVKGILGFTLVLGMIEMASHTFGGRLVPYLTGTASRSDYLDSELGLYLQAVRQLEGLPAGSRVRLMWEPRAYYCPPHVTCIPDALTDAWARPIRSGLEPDEVLRQWRGDYLLLFRAGYDFYTHEEANDPYAYAAENQLFLPAIENSMSVIWTDEVAYTLYAWNEP